MTALIPVAGLWIRRWERSLPAYVAAGLVTVALAMWSIPALLLFAISLTVVSRVGDDGEHEKAPLLIALAIVPILIFAALTLSGAATNPDFLLFWAAKGERFAFAHGIDVEFLRDPRHHFMHPDYPPLVPLTYAWTMLGGEVLHWFGAIALAPLLLAAATAAVFRFTRDAALTALFASVFAFVFIDNSIAGNAEPFLLLFEAVATGALLFGGPPIVAAIALAGAVLTKVEGTAFVAAILGALLVTRAMPWKRVAAIATPPFVVFVSWIVFCARHGLLDTYRGQGASQWNWSTLAPLVSEGALGCAYVPWIAAILLIAAGRPRAALPGILAALAFFGFLIVAWLGTNVSTEIAWSAKRVLMTPLLLLLISARAERRTAP